MSMKISEIDEILKKKMSSKRFLHTKGVQYTSICLAMRYEEDLEKASYAGLLHDCAKYLSGESLLNKARKNNLSVNETELKSPYLLHGKVGALFADTRYDVHDEDILNAIRYHTTGRPGMSLLEKIVFTADYIEPGRNQAPDLDQLRKMAFIDLDKCVLMILQQTLDYLHETGTLIDEMTQKTYDYYHETAVKQAQEA